MEILFIIVVCIMWFSVAVTVLSATILIFTIVWHLVKSSYICILKLINKKRIK